MASLKQDALESFLEVSLFGSFTTWFLTKCQLLWVFGVNISGCDALVVDTAIYFEVNINYLGEDVAGQFWTGPDKVFPCFKWHLKCTQIKSGTAQNSEACHRLWSFVTVDNNQINHPATAC